jgi:tetratricopeptide (TPR) repeat protein
MSNPEFNAEQVFQQAMQAHQSGQTDVAENLLREILVHLPNQDGIMGTLGGVLLSVGKINESIETLNKAISINPQNVDAQLNLGIAYQSVGRIDESYQLISNAADQAPDRADIQYNLASNLIHTQQYPQAIEALLQAIKLNPSFLQAYQTLGAIYTYLNRYQEAIQSYENALAIMPDDLQTSATLGNLLADIGLVEKAEAHYLEITTAHPDHFLPHALLGKFYLDIGKTALGEAALQKAFSLNPNDLNTNILLGNVNRDLGRIEDAEKYYKQALAINPEDKGALRNLRRILSSKIPYWHFEMLADLQRNDAYQKAIKKVVKPDSLVLDIGTGSGLLAMMAARAGAKKVVACEMHKRLAEAAKTITRTNGFENIIEVFSKKSTNLKVGEEVPNKVDIIISEILDVGALGEAALPSLRHAVQNLAKPDVKLIPAKVNLYGQLIEIPARSIVAPIRNISGFDLSFFEQFRIPEEYLKINLKAEKYKTLSPIIPLLDIDFYNLPPAYPDDRPRIIPLSIPISENGTVQAMVFWFDLYLDEEIMVSSKPNGELEHWGQALFCFPNPKEVKKEEIIPVSLLQSDQIIRFEM